MTHLQIELTAVGDELTAISQSVRIAKAIDETVYLKLQCGKLISVQKDSNVIDLGQIASLENKLFQLEKINNKK